MPAALPLWLVRALEAEGAPREEVGAADEAEARRLLAQVRSCPRE